MGNKITPDANWERDAAAWLEKAVSLALGFRVSRVGPVSYQVQFLSSKGRVDRVRPASREEVLMYRTLCSPAGSGPLPNNGPGFGAVGGVER